MSAKQHKKTNIFRRILGWFFSRKKGIYKKTQPDKKNRNSYDKIISKNNISSVDNLKIAEKELQKAIEDLKLQNKSKSTKIKAEAKVFPMTQYIKKDLPNLRLLSTILNKPLTFIDLETTGRPHERQFAIIELGVLFVTPTTVEERGTLIYPEMKIPAYITDITGITNDMVHGKDVFKKYAAYCAKVAREHIFIGYNSKSFDSKGLEKMIAKNGYPDTYDNQLDIFHLYLRCKKVFDGDPSRSGSLVEACKKHKIQVSGQAHRASYDIAITGLLAEKLLSLYGFGILHKDIMKLKDAEAKKRYYEYLIQNKIPAIS